MMAMAFPYLFTFGADEHGILALIRLFVEYLGEKIIHCFDHPDFPDRLSFQVYVSIPKPTAS
jgi:hypothetical protein